ncbi:outer membrane beta-barrel protein [Pontibacter sp. KCTC 32443]|uniref:outer membrane beta-barrel protein n=1 Tax=Pontibacter TaxID=323449 RepID=UPI00164E3689|nr:MULTISPECIES: outer membrane beta-barrel protein [Pontibacter]MBC5772668.1 outer membrane beta-barrel protein [Pontibacter sp. KCTC 32443]
MKKLLAVAIFGLVSTGAFAQTTQGSIVVSGSVNLSKNSDDVGNPFNSQRANLEVTTLAISPRVGFMIKDGIEVGAAFNYGHEKSDYRVDQSYSDYIRNSKKNVIGLGVYLQKYFMLSEKVAVTGMGTAGFNTGKTKLESGDATLWKSETESKEYYVAIEPGITFFPTEKIGISATFGSLFYNKLEEEPDSENGKSTYTDFGLDLSNRTLGIGFSYYISR